VALGACLALTCYTSLEYALYELLFSVVWLAIHVARRRGRAAPLLRTLGASALAFLVLAAPLLTAQLRAYARGEIRPPQAREEVVSWSPAALAFVTPSRAHPVYGRAFGFAGEHGSAGVVGMRSEVTIGIVTWLLALIGALRARRDRSIAWVLTAAVSLILALGPTLRVTGTWLTGVPLPYRALYELLPPWRASRDPTRLLPMAVLALGVLAAHGTRACMRALSGRVPPLAVAGIACGLVAFESLTAWRGSMPVERLVPSLYRQMAGARSPMLDLNPDQRALLAQTVHGRPITAGGVSVPRAAGAGRMLPVERHFRRAERFLAMPPSLLSARLDEDRRALSCLGFGHVVLAGAGARTTPEASSIELARRLGLRPVADQGLFLWEVPFAACE
jgi:hypothetical protein